MAVVIEKTIGNGGDYSTIAAWIAAMQAQYPDFVAADVICKGILVNDHNSPYLEQNTIPNQNCDANHYWWLTVSPSVRHTGKARTGAVIRADADYGYTGLLDVRAPYTRIEFIEVDGANLTDDGIRLYGIDAHDIVVEKVIVHNCTLYGLAFWAGIGGNNQFRNCISFNNGKNMVLASDSASLINYAYNVTTYNDPNDSAHQSIMQYNYKQVAINCICAGSAIYTDKTGTGWGSGTGHNISSDDSAPGPNSIHNVDAADLFVNITPGSEDLHLKIGAPALDAGQDLSTYFTDDIDEDSRPQHGAWDIGADEYVPGGQTYQEFLHLTLQSMIDLQDMQKYREQLALTEAALASLEDWQKYSESIHILAASLVRVMDQLTAAMQELLIIVANSQISVSDRQKYAEAVQFSAAALVFIVDAMQYYETVQISGQGQASIQDLQRYLEKILATLRAQVEVTDEQIGALVEKLTVLAQSAVSVLDRQKYRDEISYLLRQLVSVQDMLHGLVPPEVLYIFRKKLQATFFKELRTTFGKKAQPNTFFFPRGKKHDKNI